MSLDVCVVPTVTQKIVFVCVILAHHRRFAIAWTPDTMVIHARLIDTTILVDLLRGKEEAMTWVHGVALQARWVSVMTYVEWLAGCRHRREQRTVAREMRQYRLLHRTEGPSRMALAWFERLYLRHGVGVLDSLIGATAPTHQRILATPNTKHVAAFPGLRIERPY